MVDLKHKTLRDIDWLLLLSPIALVALGCVGIRSTAPGSELEKQVVALVIGVLLALGIMFTDYRKIIVTVAPFFYGVVIVMLIFVLFKGVEINGNKAWLRVFGFSLQPSEFAKAATILMLARHLAQARAGSLSIKDMAVMAAITLAPIILIALEHDTGTMLTFGAILGAFYFLGGMRKVFLAVGAVAVVVGLIGVYPHLKGYQKERVDVILHPEKADPRGYAYQTIQSVVAVGSGGVTGKGIGQGTQGKLGFLPFAWTDFIAAVIAEEMGLVGIILMMVLYLIFIWRLISVAKGSRDRAGALMIMGFVALIAFHILCNLGMVVALMPIMGIPLPLMSSGGTAVMAMFIGVGLALSVRMRRFVN
ncbi:MAG TPA: FtsW/RodA/SpoVE family cell cycle protein [Blastocatellia bacterium]|jgi:rod shape determining protein RodA|nr:FtsW/RodA/SpoVE family cell cycle protein [Blastocatellia bacterium]